MGTRGAQTQEAVEKEWIQVHGTHGTLAPALLTQSAAIQAFFITILRSRVQSHENFVQYINLYPPCPPEAPNTQFDDKAHATYT